MDEYRLGAACSGLPRPRHDLDWPSRIRGGQSLMFYAARGNIPPKRHTQHRGPDGSLYAEELFGVEGFTGRSSLLYHLTPPTRTHRIEAGATVALEEADDGVHHHRLIDSAGLPPAGDAVTGRVPLFFNSDVVMGVVRPLQRCRPTSSTAMAKRTSCSSCTRGRACWTRSSARCDTGRAITS
ncbi:MAG: hypothetical protein WKF78_06095 [Candidatus Limnocylindrales bacterium]